MDPVGKKPKEAGPRDRYLGDLSMDRSIRGEDLDAEAWAGTSPSRGFVQGIESLHEDIDGGIETCG